MIFSVDHIRNQNYFFKLYLEHPSYWGQGHHHNHTWGYGNHSGNHSQGGEKNNAFSVHNSPSWHSAKFDVRVGFQPTETFMCTTKQVLFLMRS
jgi:hypothetical protein